MKPRKTGCNLIPGIAIFVIVACSAALIDAQVNERAKDSKQQTIVAASNMLHPPFSSWDENKKAVGIEVEIVESAAAEIGCQVNWIERPFPELFDAIENGEIDVAVSTIGATDERKKRVAFSTPYYQTQIVALVRPESEFRSLDQLANSRIGADQSTTSFTVAKEKWPQATLVGALTAEMTWPQMVEQGIVDAFVVDASDQARLETLSGIKMRRIKQPLSSEHFSVAMKKNAVELKDAIDRAVKTHLPTIPLRIGGEFQFETPLGTRISSLSGPPASLVKKYVAAKNQYQRNPGDVEAVIWYGRRAGYLFRMNEAIRIFSVGINNHPADARLYRHRGHRYISTRQFDKAIADLEKAVKLIDGQEDQIEPDGAPNPQGIRLTTLHGNIWYHLGLAYYLKNDLDNALRAYRECQKTNRNDDNIVSSAHWLYMILRRQGKHEEAAEIVKDVKPNMNIIENMTYHRMCLMYSGKQVTALQVLPPADQLQTTTASPNKQSVEDVLLYGLGNWYLYHESNETKAREQFENLLKNGSPFSFAYIAAESDFVRLFKNKSESR